MYWDTIISRESWSKQLLPYEKFPSHDKCITIITKFLFYIQRNSLSSWKMVNIRLHLPVHTLNLLYFCISCTSLYSSIMDSSVLDSNVLIWHKT